MMLLLAWGCFNEEWIKVIHCIEFVYYISLAPVSRLFKHSNANNTILRIIYKAFKSESIFPQQTDMNILKF